MQYETTENESIETMTSIYDSHDRFNIVGPTPLGDCCDHIGTMALVIVAIDNGKDLISVSSIVGWSRDQMEAVATIAQFFVAAIVDHMNTAIFTEYQLTKQQCCQP